jgi:hypothetical protein
MRQPYGPHLSGPLRAGPCPGSERAESEIESAVVVSTWWNPAAAAVRPVSAAAAEQVIDKRIGASIGAARRGRGRGGRGRGGRGRTVARDEEQLAGGEVDGRPGGGARVGRRKVRLALCLVARGATLSFWTRKRQQDYSVNP